MPRIFITGSSDGLGRAAARSLLRDGHEVLLHARSSERAHALADLAPRCLVDHLSGTAAHWSRSARPSSAISPTPRSGLRSLSVAARRPVNRALHRPRSLLKALK